MTKNFLTQIEKFSFYLLLFILPFNIRKIIFFREKFFNEYQSAFLYAADILIIGILIMWLCRWIILKFPISNLQFPNKFQIPNSKFQIFLFLFIAWSLISLSWAENSALGFSKWLRLLEFSLFFLYIKNNLANYDFKKIALIIIASGIFQSLIAFLQFASQSSIGIHLLGESIFKWGLPGTATFRLFGAKIIRASGTLPHANLLAAILLFSLFFAFYLYLQRKHYPPFSRFSFKHLLKEIGLVGIFYFLFLGIIFSFSRSAILLAAIFIPLALFYLLLNKKLKSEYFVNAAKLTAIFMFIGAFLIIIFFNFLFARANISLGESAINDRLRYNQMAVDLIKQSPIKGIGFGNYIWHLNQNNIWKDYGFFYPHLFQPVHNIYLLIASEIGIVGLALFLILLFFIIRHSWNQNKNILLSTFYFLLSIFLFWGFSDHFFWTIHQGQLIWWIVLGILASKPP